MRAAVARARRRFCCLNYLGAGEYVRFFHTAAVREEGSKKQVKQPRKEGVSEGGLWSLDVGGGAVINFPLMAT